MFNRMGVRGRLLLAFFGISALAIVVAGAALISFALVGQVLERITKTHVPAVINTIEISRQAERIVAAAPTLLAAETAADRSKASGDIFAQLQQLNTVLKNLRTQERGSEATRRLKPVVDQLAQNLVELDRSVTFRLSVVKTKQRLLDELTVADKAIQNVLAPNTMVLDAKFSRLARMANKDGISGSERDAVLQDLIQLVAATLPLQTAQSEAASINDMLVFSALATSKADIDALAFPLRRSQQNFERMLSKLAETDRVRLVSEAERLAGLITGDHALPATRVQELDLVAQGRALLARNGALSSELTEIVNVLVAKADNEITTSGQDAQSAQTIGSLVIMIVSALSLLSAGLVIWRYVSGNLLARITNLSDSMTAIAKGNLHAPLPAATDTDEIAQMTLALRVFRDTALEVQKTNLVEVQTARQRLQEAISSLSQGFALFDQKDQLLICNARYREIMLSGDAQDALDGMPLAQIVEAAAKSGRFAGARGNQTSWQAAHIRRIRSGVATFNEQFDQDQWAQVTVRRTEEVGTVVVMSDITEIQRISEELGHAKDEAEAANEAKSTFLASMSHEIRTPLNGIMGMSALLSGTKLDPEQRDFASTINQAAETLLTIINDILDFSKVEAGAMEIEQVPIDLTETIESAVELLAGKASEKGIEFACGVSKDTPQAIIGDSVRLKQVLLNLLNNAIKFTDTGEVELSVDLAPRVGSDPQLRLTIRDTGIGIPTDRMDRLFKSFSQIDASTTRRFGGTGLGLVITQRLVTLMGGEISVESTQGVGTTFTVHLPFVDTVLPPAQNQSEMLDLVRNRSVLVVDDNATNLRILGERLLGWDIQPELANSPEKALKLLRNDVRFDAVIMDYKMPGQNGLELAMNIRALKGDNAPPLILYSSIPLLDEAMRKRVADAKFAGQLMKPAKTLAMLSTLARAICPEVRLAEHVDQSFQEGFATVEGGLEILLVDDNAINRKIGAKILSRLGYDPSVVNSGEAAIDTCMSRRFDIVFMDIEMPDMDGIEATAALRDCLPINQQPYFIALTANAMASDRESYLRSGMNDYLSKPIDIEKLAECLKRAQHFRQSNRPSDTDIAVGTAS